MLYTAKPAKNEDINSEGKKAIHLQNYCRLPVKNKKETHQLYKQ
jgi:hypothetical protein